MATYTAVAGGGNWSNNATWGGAGHPVAGDTALLDATSGNVIIDASSACAVVNCTGYTGTLTHSAEMTTTGNVTFVAGMTLTSTSTWIMDTAGQTFIPAGKTIYNYTLLANGHIHITTSDLVVSNNLTTPQSADIQGGQTITMTGASGTLSGGAKNDINLTLNPGAGGTITMVYPSVGDDALAFGHNLGNSYTLTLSSGSFDTTACYGARINIYDSFTITGISLLDCGITVNNTCTLTLNQDTVIRWDLIVNNTWTLTLAGAGNLYDKRHLTLSGSGTLIGGTVYMSRDNFNQTWTIGTGSVSSNIVISTVSPYYCLLSTNASTTGNLTITAGVRVILATGSTHACANFNATGASGSHITLYSNNPGTRATFNVTTPQTVTYVDATDIDSAGGDPITTTGGSVTNCVNWAYQSAVNYGIFPSNRSLWAG